jgi:predicted acylesterase/phospholipase RssA/CRP-like cAMP-binding protein
MALVTTSAANSKGAVMSDEIIPLLEVHEYFRGVSDEALREVAAAARLTTHPAGAVVHEANAPVTTVAFVLRGRLKAVRVDSHGRESFFRMIDRGEQFGMMVGAVSEPVPIRVIALAPTTVLDLDYEQAMDLTVRHLDLRKLWLTTFAGSLRKHFFGVSPRRAPTLLGLIHESPAARGVAGRLVERLRAAGERIAVFSDSDQWRATPDLRFRPLTANGQTLDAEAIHAQKVEWQDANRIVFDVSANLEPETASRLLDLVDFAVYFVPASVGDAAARRLHGQGGTARTWREKLVVAWLIDGASTVAPATPDFQDFASRDFKIVAQPAGGKWGRSLSSGLERLVHHLRGIRIGVALGGGAARGMAHLGVLKSLEQAGIVIDAIAGTSAGAMTGVLYSAGIDSDYAAERFSADLAVSWPFRHLPRGDQWFLLYKYRRGHFDPMLRKYLHDWRLEQLSLPCMSVTADLVSGAVVVRDRGDAVEAILESINLPVLSVPICRNGQALIDGGLMNNIPADVLVAAGCNFVIAVSVTAKMEKQFAHIRPDVPTRLQSRPGIVSTILRSLLVQNYSLNAIGVSPADVVIEPDVTAFEMTAFMKAKELAAIGEAEATRQVPAIRRLLSRLDPQLFGQAS